MINIHALQLIDLTHTLHADIPHWGTGCAFHHTIGLDYKDCPGDVKFKVCNLTMHAGIGTHMDAPAHCFPDGKTIDKMPLSELIVPCVMIDVSDKAHETYNVSRDDIIAFETQHGTIPQNSCVLIYTGWEQHWNNPEKYRNNLIFPSISVKAAELLVSRNIIGIGIDTLSPDRANDGFPVHNILLGAGKYIIENVANAKALTPTGAYVMALPIKIQDGTEAPIRLVGMYSR